MPLQKLQLRPGVNRESTTYANEGGWFESDKIRFRSGQPEKIGGWTNLAANNVDEVTNTYIGVARSMTDWVTFDYSKLNGVGTNQKFYIESGGQYHDVTPLTSGSPVSLGVNPFSSVSGSRLVTVTIPAHEASPGTWVTFSGALAFGGFTDSQLNTSFEVISANTGNLVTIILPTEATSTTTGGGSAVIVDVELAAGGAVYSTSNGWGSGPWNGVNFGYPTSTLSSDITDSDTTITVALTTGFASPAGTIVIEAEIIHYTGITVGASTVTFNGCVRPSNLGVVSPATAHIAGVRVRQYSSQTTGPSAYGWGEPSNTANSLGSQLRLWTSDNFGQNLLLAPRGGSIYYWTVLTPTVTYPRAITLKAQAALAGYTNTHFIPNSALSIVASDVQRFVIAFGTNSYDPNPLITTTVNPMLVRWSDQENPYQWEPSSTNQAGEYTLAGGSMIVAAKPSKQEILIWTDAALFSMQYLGPPYVWGFNQLAGNVSIISPNAVATANNQTFWMGVDKFYVYNGRVDTLPCALRQYVFNDINQVQAYQVVSGTNEGFNEVWWMYPSFNSSVNDRYVVYNHLENIWYYGNINRTAWLDSPLRGFPMGAFSVQNTYLDTNINNSVTSITVLNGYTYPYSGILLIDDECITYTGHTQEEGNTISNCVRGAFNPLTDSTTTAASHNQYSTVTYLTPNQVMYHENGTDDCSLLSSGQAIPAYVQSSDFDIGDGHNFGFVYRMLPDVTFDGSTAETPQLTISVRPRQNSGTPYGVGNSPAVVSGNNYQSPFSHNYVVQLFTGQVFTRIRGRQMAFKIQSTGLGVAWQLGATRIDVRPDGRR